MVERDMNIDKNNEGANTNVGGHDDGRPMMSEALSNPVIVAIHTDEAIVGCRDVMRESGVPEEDVQRNLSEAKKKLEHLTNGDLRKGLKPLHAIEKEVLWKLGNNKANGSVSKKPQLATSIEISE